MEYENKHFAYIGFISPLFYLSFSDGSPEIQRNGLFSNISVYGYGPPEITRFFRLIAHRHDGILTGLYLIPFVVHGHAFAGGGDTLYAEHFLSSIVEGDPFVNSLISAYRTVMVFRGIRLDDRNRPCCRLDASNLLQIEVYTL